MLLTTAKTVRLTAHPQEARLVSPGRHRTLRVCDREGVGLPEGGERRSRRSSAGLAFPNGGFGQVEDVLAPEADTQVGVRERHVTDETR